MVWVGPLLVSAVLLSRPVNQPRPRDTGTLSRLVHGVRPYVELDGRSVGGLLPREVDRLLASFAKARDLAPVNANIDRDTGAVVPDRDGRKVDVATTRRMLMSALPFAKVHTVVRVVHARWRADDLRQLTQTLSRYRTWISGSGERRQNIVVAAHLIHNVVVFPGETFSTIDHVGPGSRTQGYRAAPTIQDGQMVPGIGGGVCQLSSTLYNAADLAGMRIVERHHHGLPIHYVPAGRDATITMPGDHPPSWWVRLDFRFRNTLNHPIILRAAVSGWRLSVWVDGHAADQRLPKVRRGRR